MSKWKILKVLGCREQKRLELERVKEEYNRLGFELSKRYNPHGLSREQFRILQEEAFQEFEPVLRDYQSFMEGSSDEDSERYAGQIGIAEEFEHFKNGANWAAKIYGGVIRKLLEENKSISQSIGRAGERDRIAALMDEHTWRGETQLEKDRR